MCDSTLQIIEDMISMCKCTVTVRYCVTGNLRKFQAIKCWLPQSKYRETTLGNVQCLNSFSSMLSGATLWLLAVSGGVSASAVRLHVASASPASANADSPGSKMAASDHFRCVRLSDGVLDVKIGSALQTCERYKLANFNSVRSVALFRMSPHSLFCNSVNPVIATFGYDEDIR